MKRPGLIRLGSALAALSLFAAVGCGGDEESSEPAPPPASPALSEEERAAKQHEEEAVASLTALLKEVDRLHAEGPGAEVTDEAEQHATDPYLQQLDHSLEWLSVESIRVKSPSTRLLIEPQGEATGEQVDVVVCVDTSTEKTVDAESGEPYEDGAEAIKRLDVYPVHKVDGAWKAKDRESTVLESWDQAPCDGSWES